MEDTNPKTQHGLKKAQHHLTPTTALEEMAGAFELGAKKYGAFNWRERTVSASTYVSAAKRHIDAWWERQEVDPESGRHHLGHALACLAILVDAQKFKNIVDDRPKVGLHGAMSACDGKSSEYDTPERWEAAVRRLQTDKLLPDKLPEAGTNAAKETEVETRRTEGILVGSLEAPVQPTTFVEPSEAEFRRRVASVDEIDRMIKDIDRAANMLRANGTT